MMFAVNLLISPFNLFCFLKICLVRTYMDPRFLLNFDTQKCTEFVACETNCRPFIPKRKHARRAQRPKGKPVVQIPTRQPAPTLSKFKFQKASNGLRGNRTAAG